MRYVDETRHVGTCKLISATRTNIPVIGGASLDCAAEDDERVELEQDFHTDADFYCRLWEQR
jgi:hypothetical protein